MKRSDMVRQMTEHWLGLFPYENFQDQDVQLEVQERMAQLLDFLERKGMKPPLKEKCPVLFTDKHVWERE